MSAECPWFCGGDLNEILWEFEKTGGCDDFHTRPRFLHEFMTNMKLIDLGVGRNILGEVLGITVLCKKGLTVALPMIAGRFDGPQPRSPMAP